MKPPILPGIRFSSLNALKITGFTQGSSVSEVLPPGFLPTPYSVVCCSVAQLYPTLHPHGLQRARLPCPAPFSGVPSNSCPLSWWCHPTISSYATHFSSCPHPFPASGWRKWEKNHRAATSDPVLHPDKALRAGEQKPWTTSTGLLGFTHWVPFRSCTWMAKMLCSHFFSCSIHLADVTHT